MIRKYKPDDLTVVMDILMFYDDSVGMTSIFVNLELLMTYSTPLSITLLWQSHWSKWQQAILH